MEITIERNIKKAILPYQDWLNVANEWGVFPKIAIKGDDLKGQLKPYGCNSQVIKKDCIYAITKSLSGKILIKRLGMSEKTRANYEKGWNRYGSSSILREIL